VAYRGRMTSTHPAVWRTPVRDVHVRVGTQTNCSGIAIARADFEPPADPAEGFVFVVALEYREGQYQDEELAAFCCEHVEAGVREELTRRADVTLPAVRIVLRYVLQHPVDSNELRNREAGRLLVTRALERLSEA
jgi:hypothetical protein